MPPSAPPNLRRKSTGAYYTPQPLINLLLTHAQPPTPAHAPPHVNAAPPPEI
jgi:hypothetical protein